MFRTFEGSVQFPQLEEEVLAFWRDHEIFEKSIDQRKDAPAFVFYEGPPTANGLPHPGHCLTRSIKDLFPRYRTMRGQRCERKAGWDTHGLPVEVEVCKELGIHSKEEIEEFGMEPFIQKCQQSVWRYMQDWEKLTERLGFWVHLKDAYVTYHQSYVESVWWSLKNLFERGLLYQGHKIVWWWAQGGTALSAGEVGEGYREVADPSVYVKFPLIDAEDTLKDAELLVWTTTPWTLPSNQFAAVSADLEYSLVKDSETGEKLVLASALVETVGEKVKHELKVLETFPGQELLGLRYRPPFDYYYKSLGDTLGKLKEGGEDYLAWRVVPCDFVNTDSGTGVVHQAPAFGEDDYQVLTQEQAKFEFGEGPDLICAVGPNGKFTSEAPDYEGRWVKEADKDISRQLRQEGKLYHLDQYLHKYPFCWRAEEDPLIQYPRQSWFVRTTQFKDEMLANNQGIKWLPSHIQSGRFGNFLETNVDWALSRERFWGTPLPIWVCEKTGKMEAIDCYQELLAKPGVSGTEVWEAAKEQNPDLPEDLKVHRPYIDAIEYDSPFDKGSRMRRVPEVIDCWYDSGSMPFAQWGYPHKGKEQFNDQYPADFISEAIDQTRGWFYTQLALSTLLFGPGANAEKDPNRPVTPYPHPFKNCIVLGLMLGEDGKKMSKSKKNYREPKEIFDRYGADALRWYFFANQPPWTEIRYNEQSIKESVPEFLLRLWNCYSFFAIYANIDEFSPDTERLTTVGDLNAAAMAKAEHYSPLEKRSELDRWILSELEQTTQTVVERMDAFDNFAACKSLTTFVDALSNWYVRRSRSRFWASEKNADKWDAYWTLYECLVQLAKLIAPFTPFLAETLWRYLVVVPFGDRAKESVHLCNFPEPNLDRVDESLSRQMEMIREMVSLGRSARQSAKLKVRQPLSKVEVILADTTHQAWLEEHAELVAEELNVKNVEFTQDADQYIEYKILPDLKRLGPKLGKAIPELRKYLQQADPRKLLATMQKEKEVTIELPSKEVTLGEEDLLIRLEAKPGWSAAQGDEAVVVLSTEITPQLIAEGLAREVIHAIQNQRKEMGCEYTDRIEVGLVGDDEELAMALEQFGDYIQGETLATCLQSEPLSKVDPSSIKVAGQDYELYLRKVSQ
ncbi:Isoleucyl-tRNA synthetase [Planctomycetales bacterium 10988]|nr:Isoleucyl-tRNA synthetase [Planctomycetales bacterium 10988]